MNTEIRNERMLNDKTIRKCQSFKVIMFHYLCKQMLFTIVFRFFYMLTFIFIGQENFMASCF